MLVVEMASARGACVRTVQTTNYWVTLGQDGDGGVVMVSVRRNATGKVMRKIKL